MHKQFSLIDLIEIFYEKKYIFIIALVVCLIAAWYVNSKVTSKYLIRTDVYHTPALQQKDLLDLSSLFFYEKFTNANIGPIIKYSEKKYIESFSTKYHNGSIYAFIKKIDLNYSSPDFDEKLMNDKFLKYSFDNLIFDYMSHISTLKLSITVETEDDLDSYIKAFFEYIDYMHSSLKKDYLKYFEDINNNSIEKINRDIEYVKNLHLDLENLEQNNIIRKDDDYLIHLTKMKLLLVTFSKVLKNNKIILDNIKNNMNFKLIDSNINTLIVRSLHVRPLTIYSSIIAVYLIIFTIYLLVLLGFRNR